MARSVLGRRAFALVIHNKNPDVAAGVLSQHVRMSTVI